MQGLKCFTVFLGESFPLDCLLLWTTFTQEYLTVTDTEIKDKKTNMLSH